MNPRTNVDKLEHLSRLIRELGSLLVCYSGGIDSALVLAVATRELGSQAIGMTAVSPSLAEAEHEDAARVARQLGARHYFVHSHEIERPGYVQNGPDRCFHCKTELYTIAQSKASEWQLQYIANGTNTDDLGDYRPGLEAARQAGVKSPLVDAGLNKADVRELSRHLELPIWDKPAAACLSSRIPYGSAVTPERLGQIGGFEAELRQLGLRQVRVRWHDAIARIEVPVSELGQLLNEPTREAILQAGKRHGFTYVTLDLAGYRQGSHNELLQGRSLRLI
ncbi:MAG TPA: ATP-dependent sacrificial sulfur transferase LarE [Polyangiaceae bacterium]|nr:ATP-dependent sacrificial sulfur transferase LarE [Polyangiaceae bacterium]